MSCDENPQLPAQNACGGPEAVDQGENLKALIKQLVKERQYEGVALLFTSAGESVKNVACLPQIAMDLYHDVCQQYLIPKTYYDNVALFNCAEELLKTLAAHAPAEELLLELLELIEDNSSEHVFTSALRALQVVLLRQGNLKPRALEWSLNSIVVRRDSLPVLSSLEEGYDLEQEALLEQDDETQNLLMFYITVGLFYDPLITNICSKSHKEAEVFRTCEINRRNVMCCFLVEMLGKPLALLDLSNGGENKKTNTYSLQCARSLTEGITKCIMDPMFLLSFVEAKVRWKPRLNEANGIHKRNNCNIFLIDDKLPLDCLAIYYYMVVGEGINSAQIPVVYNPLYIFEMGLYLVQELLISTQPALHAKSLKLAEKLLANLSNTWQISSSALDLEIHKSFCNSLCQLLTYSHQTHLRQQGVQILKQYIISFDDEGKYLILKNLMRTVAHRGICGYLATIYKDLVAEALKNAKQLPKSFSGPDFRSIFIQNICKLQNGVETDLIDNADQIISSLNALRFFAIKDAKNRTGFWSFVREIDSQFIVPLRKGLDLSEAHYKAELHNVHEGRDMSSLQNLNILDISIPNDSSASQDANLSLIACRTLASSTTSSATAAQSHEQQQLTQHWNSECSSNSCTKHSPHKTLTFLYPRVILSHRRYCTKYHAKDQTSSIDEFRAREEKREEEFEQQEKSKSQDEENLKNAKVEAIRVKVLEAALHHVPTLGWTRNAIVQGAEEAGYPSVVHGMFPEGGFDLVSFFNGKCNDELLKSLQKETDNGAKEIANPLEFLVRFVRMRLEMMAPYKGQWPQALALIALPQNASTALAQVLTLVDDICYYSGDRSVDMGWYTRRIGLATIFKMTELYMLQDNSPDHNKTWEFLQNRMDEAVQLQMILQSTENVTSKFHRSFNSAFITARNILGLNYNRP